MTETNITRAITGLIVAGIVWCISSISTLITSDGMQEVHIQNGIEADARLLAKQGSQGERIASVESEVNGLSVSIGIIIKNQDRMLAKLDANH